MAKKNSNEGGFQVEVVVRKNPKPEPYIKHLKNGTVKFIFEVTQEQMDASVTELVKKHFRKEE